MMRLRGWILAVMMCIGLTASACRFTVREIGFSTLSRDMYSLVVMTDQSYEDIENWKKCERRLVDSNIRMVLLHPEDDATHPFTKLIKRKYVRLPSYVLIAPDDHMLKLSRSSLNEVVETVLESPVRTKLRTAVPDGFAVILWVHGKKYNDNNEMRKIVKDARARIVNVMPHMPKEVKNGPFIQEISEEIFQKEKILMWSLGLMDIPDRPQAFILYGRGRMMGGAVALKNAREGYLFKLLSMIGADCECGLDRKWMLGDQVPLLWNKKDQKQLVDIVGFDVDNPMILAEMSRIIDKETNPDVAGEVSFGPDVIDLNEAFKSSEDEIKPVLRESEESIDWKYFILILIVIIVVVGILLYRKNQRG
ncbi:hypothetical protein EYV94_04430 [Puteibacter caeruleilacunae]|nr:hypothetical protein EYV94_04430 [Puteibacter caeruleilacunae]